MIKKNKKFKTKKIITKKSNISVEVENLSFKYNPNKEKNIIDNISFSIKHGDYLAIIGHNGSGKSTLSKLIIGVLLPLSGKIKIFGNVLTKENLSDIRQFLGIVFQNPDNQFIGSTVEDDIAFGLENHRINPKKMKDIILDAAKKVKMEKFLDYEPLMLSGGQKQRVAIASTLALKSDIIIFDESTSMLDPSGKIEIKKIMKDLKGSKTIISVTHDMDEVLNADKVIILNNGKIVKSGEPENIFKDKNFLTSIKLDTPFISNIIYELNKKGINISNTFDEERLINDLCQLKKVKK